MIDLFGVSIYDPDVVITDLGLAGLGAYLAWRIWNVSNRATLQTAGAILLGGLASAAFWGAVFHAFFPGGTTTRAGFIAWSPVALSIVTVSATLVALALYVLSPHVAGGVRRVIVTAYAVAFTAVVLLVDESFSTIVAFYGPTLLLFLIVAARETVRTRAIAWKLVTVGFIVSIGAAAIQQARVAIHPVYFDHNALYHVVQGGAVVLLYFGFRRARLASSGL